MDFKQIKPTIQKKDNIVQLGSNTQNVGISGSLDVRGNVRIGNPFSEPPFGANDNLVVFTQTSFGDFKFVAVTPNTVLSQDISSGLDYFFAESALGFNDTKDWVLNPGATNMESGKITYKLNSKIFISGSGINSGLYFDHNKGERLNVI